MGVAEGLEAGVGACGEVGQGTHGPGFGLNAMDWKETPPFSWL